MNIFLSGASAHLATVMLPILCNDPGVARVVGIDIKPTLFKHEKFFFHAMDVRSPEIVTLLDNIDVVIHFAFVVLRSSLKSQRRNRELVFDINVNGSINLFNASKRAQVSKLIHLSSASVYGAWPDNPPAISEAHPRRVMRGFSYAEDKNAVEDWLDDFERTNDHIRVIRLRPHVILGPNAQPFLIRLLKQPFYPRVAKPYPLLQCVWETDVARAIMSCCERDVAGAFNLATSPAISFYDMLSLLHRFPIPLPAGLAVKLHALAWRLTGALEEPGWLGAMHYSLVIDSARARHELDWVPDLNTEQCIKAL